jgi:non-heme chloroperoxidase
MLAADSWGDPDDPPVVLLHGGGQTRHAWKGVGATLARHGFHAVAFDARGHGESDWSPDGGYGVDTMIGDLRAVMRNMHLVRPALVGASMGGATSLVAVGERHVDASALVLVDFAPRLEMEGVGKILAFMNQRPDGFGSLEEVAEAIAAYQPQRERRFDPESLRKNVRLGPDGRWRWHWDPRFLPQAHDVVERQRRLEAAARTLTLPTLVVRGAMSDVLSEAGSRQMKTLCPHCETVDVGGAGHMVAGDRNDVFGEAVVGFLERVRPQA